VVRQVPLVLSHQQQERGAAEAACRRDLDVLIDACGAERVLIRHVGVRQAMVAGRPGPVTVTARVAVYLIGEVAG
jgi:hypothetical protein